VVAYAPSLRGYFLSDDFHVVTILNAGRTAVDWTNVLSDFYRVYRGDPTHSYYRPLVTLSAGIDYSVWGPNPFGGHLTNLLLALACGLLVYGIAVSLPPQAATGTFALLAGLLFTLHPLHPEAVYWLSGRTELIMTCFALLSIMLYLMYVRRRRRAHLLLSIATFALALASKETAVTVPFALTLHRALFPSAGADGPSRSSPFLLAPYYLLLVIYFLGRRAITGHFVGQYGPTSVQPFAPSLVPAGILNLVAVQLYPIGDALLSPPFTLLPWVLILAVLALLIGSRIDRRAWFCLGLMLVFAAPLLSLLAERGAPDDAPRIYYLPSVGFCLFLAALLVNARRWIRRWLAPALVGTFAALHVANSLPWIEAGLITKAIVRGIERAANTPGVTQVVVVGYPDFYLGAELFGTKAWAMSVAAVPPFANIPRGVRVTTPTDQPCVQLAAGRLTGSDRTIVLSWNPEQRGLAELPPRQLREICRTPPGSVGEFPSDLRSRLAFLRPMRQD
jgi:hypothetical protein